MGLSILIPVYNFPVKELVHSLSEQVTRSGRKAEIILLNDGSDESFSPLLSSLGNELVKVYNNETNEGRMAARLKLCSFSSYDFLLFLDADSVIVEPDFIANYFSETDESTTLVCGGRVYSQKPPQDCEKVLHWKYGSQREIRTATHQPGFMSNNFLIRKELFQKLDHTSDLKVYGHEDTWWGIQFEQMGVPVKYIHNPVLHGSLENAVTFIQKSEQALHNLLLLEKTMPISQLVRHVKIYRWYYRLKKWKLADLFLFFEKRFHNRFRKNLLSCNPNLSYFDYYRLAKLIRMADNKAVEAK